MCADNPRYTSAGGTDFYKAQLSASSEIFWVSELLWTMGDIFETTSGAKELKSKKAFLDPWAASVK